MATPIDWDKFLKEYAAELGQTDWPGNSGASEVQLTAAEGRLKVKLPPSYRTFLGASNGWRNKSEAVPVLRSIDKVKWFRKEHKEWVSAYIDPMQGIPSPILDLDYFGYTDESRTKFDPKHLAQCLSISDIGDEAVILLNPMVVWQDGEWEAWLFANWIPGATRYRSFAELMQHQLAKGRSDTNPVTTSEEYPTVYRDGPAKPERRIVERERIPEMPDILKNLKSPKEPTRAKAVRQLSRVGGAEAVSTLITTLKTDPEDSVRYGAAEALGRIGAEDALDALIAAVEDHGVNTGAVHAIGQIKGERAAQYLLRLIESHHQYSGVAEYALANRRDDRAIPLLVRLLVSKDPTHKRRSDYIGRSIADHRNDAAYLALANLLDDADWEIRYRACLGLGDLAYTANDKDTKLKARELLKARQKTESDERVRELMARSVEF